MTTKSQLEELEKSYYAGVLKVREGDTWIEYQSMSHMRIAIQDAKAELNNTRPKGSHFVKTSKGYESNR